MGIVKGALEWKKFKNGEKLSRKQAILAMCFECNGQEESGVDCMQDEPIHGELSCPLYQFHPHRPKNKKKVTQKQLENFKKMQAQKFKGTKEQGLNRSPIRTK